MTLLDRLQRLASEEISLLPPATESQIAAFRNASGYALTDEFVAMACAANGFDGKFFAEIEFIPSGDGGEVDVEGFDALIFGHDGAANYFGYVPYPASEDPANIYYFRHDPAMIVFVAADPIPVPEARQSSDGLLAEFAATLAEDWSIADLREPQPGGGIDLRLWLNYTRHPDAMVFALEPHLPKKPGFFSRLLGVK